MTLSEEDVLWYKQNIPNTPFKDFEKIINVIGNGNGEAKTGVKQSKNEKTAPVTYLQKYSDNQILAEAVIIDKEPCFLVSENGIITPKKQILDGDRIIQPFLSEMYINRPYIFKSISEVQRYIEETKNETLDSFYKTVKIVWKKIC